MLLSKHLIIGLFIDSLHHTDTLMFFSKSFSLGRSGQIPLPVTEVKPRQDGFVRENNRLFTPKMRFYAEAKAGIKHRKLAESDNSIVEKR